MTEYRAVKMDGLQNLVTGLGTSKSKRSHNTWRFDMLNDFGSLDAAYQSNWIARQIVDIPAQDMTREWRRIKSEQAEDIEAVEQEFCVPIVVKEALQWARLYGGSVILMLTGQDLTKPLDVNRIGKGDLERLIVFDRWELSAMQINTWDILAENYFRPEMFTVQNGSQQIHHSHFVKFYGDLLPRRQWTQTQGWGDSVLRKCIDDVTDMVAGKDGVAELMQEANVDLIRVRDLASMLASDQDEAILKRYELFSQMKSVIHCALLDMEEEYDRKTLQLSGVAQVLETFITWISGAARIPVTKLFGTSAKGLNATGEGDLKTYYDDIRAEQKSSLMRPMSVLDQVLVRSAVDQMPDDYDYIWNPLSQMDPVETAQADLLRAQKDVQYLDAGIVQRSQIMRNLQSNEEYQFDDAEIDSLAGLEEPTMFEEPAMPEGEQIPSAEGPVDPLAVDPNTALNGAQVTALLDVIERVRVGQITKETAALVLSAAFPITEAESQRLMANVQEGSASEQKQGEPDNFVDRYTAMHDAGLTHDQIMERLSGGN